MPDEEFTIDIPANGGKPIVTETATPAAPTAATIPLAAIKNPSTPDPEPLPTPPPYKGWICKVCSYHNAPTSATCARCGSAKPAIVSAP